MVQPYQTCLSNRAQPAYGTEHEFGVVRQYWTTSSHEFDSVEPHRTHASLWPDTCSCSALCLCRFSKSEPHRIHAWLRRGSSQPNLLEQHSTTRASIRPQAIRQQDRMSWVWFDPTALMRACGLILALFLCSVAQAGSVWLDPTEPAWATEHKSKCQVQARMSSVWFDPTKPACLTKPVMGETLIEVTIGSEKSFVGVLDRPK